MRIWTLELEQINGWVATLFMIGAALFATGCVLYLAHFSHELIIDAVFFTGSIFFTSAAYCQFYQAINDNTHTARRWFGWQPQSVLFWSALTQFIGTLMFNMNTFDAFFNLDWFEQELLVWTPNILGSILFQISGSLAVYEICGRGWCWPSFRQHHDIHWWINFINFLGCVAFLVSALLAFAVPGSVSDLLAIWSTLFTLLGACCFFIGAFLMWPEMILSESGHE